MFLRQPRRNGLHEHMANFETAGMVFRNPQAIYGSVAMGITKGSNSYRMVTDYRAVNDTIEPAAMPMPGLEDEPSLSASATVCLLYTSPSPRDKRQSRMPSSA